MHTSTDSRPRRRRHSTAPAQRAAARSQERLAGLAGLVLLAVAVWLAWAAERPPAPEPASAPPRTFSAERAMRHLERIAGDEATPVGSAGGDAIRDYLVEQLAALGLDVEVQAGVGAHAFDTITAGRAENVIALIPGHDPTGRIVLAAHYDSPTTSPGTSDDKMSVAAILEIARALTSGGQLRNDVLLLLSDGEEPGLIGAEVFARHHRYAADGGVMINLEGPGNAGPSTLYNTTSDNAGLVAEFARSVPRAVGGSAVSEVYRASPFNSDLTVLREFGFVGLEFGPIGGRTYYHHPRDTVENLSPASLQHHGENGLAMVRALAGRDLDDLRGKGDATFFSVFGQAVHYPMTFVWPLAALGVVAVLGLAVLARVRRLTSVSRLLAAVLLTAVPLAAAPLVATVLWRVLVWLRPAYAHLMSAQPYRPQLYMLALVTATAAILVVWFLAARRRVGAAALSIGALLWPAAFGAAMAALVPGMSAYGSLTALAGALGAAAVVQGERGREGSGSAALWRAAALTAGALPGAVLWSSGGRSLLSALGVGMAFPAVAFFVMGALPALPLLALALPEGGGRRRGRAAVPAALGTVTVVLVAAGLLVDRTDADHPDTAHLMYVQDADAGTAWWGTVDARPHPWAARYVPHAGDRHTAAPLPFGIELARTGPAEPTPLPPPQVTVLEQRAAGDATMLRLRVRSGRDAYALGVHVDRPVRAATVEVPGQPATELPAPERDPSSPWPWEVQFHDPPAEGIELALTVPGTGRLRVGITDWTNGLDAVPGYEPRPSDLVRQPAGAPSDAVVVTRILEP